MSSTNTTYKLNFGWEEEHIIFTLNDTTPGAAGRDLHETLRKAYSPNNGLYQPLGLDTILTSIRNGDTLEQTQAHARRHSYKITTI